MATSVGVSQQINPLEHLIGGPLQAIIRAHELSIKESLDFLSNLAFDFETGQNEGAKKDPGEPSTPKLRMMEFSYIHPVPDPDNPGNIIDTPSHVSVPLLSMIPMPNLSISEANLEFNIRVIDVTPAQSVKTETTIHKAAIPRAPRLTIHSTYSLRNFSPVVSKREEPSTISVSIKLKKEEGSEAEKRLVSLVQDAITSRAEEEEPTKEDSTKEKLKLELEKYQKEIELRKSVEAKLREEVQKYKKQLKGKERRARS